MTMWIEGKLPPYLERVLVLRLGDAEPRVQIGYRNHTDASGDHWMNDQNKSIAVMCWMPLPDIGEGYAGAWDGVERRRP